MKLADPPASPAQVSAPRGAASTYAWAVVGMLWFICFFNYADRVAVASVFPILEKRYGFNKTELGWIGAAFTWVYAAAAPIAGHVGDRYPRKFVILGGLYIWSLVTGLTGFCSKVWQFVLVRGSEGLGETFYMPASMALVSDYHTPATRSRAIGLHQTSIYAGTIGGAALAGWMGQRFGWQSPFWALAMAGVTLGAILHRFIREPARNQAERLAQESPADAPAPAAIPMRLFLAEFFRTPTALLLVAAFFGAQMVAFVFLTWMPTFMKEKFGLSLAMAGLGATFFIQVASMIGAGIGGVVADRAVQERPEGRIQVQGWAILAAAPFVVLCGYTRSPVILMLAMTAFGLGKGIYDASLTAAFYDVISADRRSTATGLMNFVGWIGAGLGSILIGIAVDHHVTMSVAIASTGLIYVAVAALLAWAVLFTARRDILAARARSR